MFRFYNPSQLAELGKKKKKGNEIDLCNEYIEFVVNELQAVQAIEFNIALDLFLGEDEASRKVEKILKYKKSNILHSIWNAAWDILFLRNLQMEYVNNNYKTQSPKLLTADKGIIDLSKYCNLRIGIKDNELGKSILEFSNEGIKPKFSDYAEKIEKEIFFSSASRMETFKSHENNYERIMGILKRLEQIVLNK